MTTRTPLVPAFSFVLRLLSLVGAGLLASGVSVGAPVSHLQVKVLTGNAELTAGSLVELRIYEAGRPVRHLPLTHGEAWPRESSLMIPLNLSEPLDSRGVLRYGLFYRASSPLSPPWEVVSAEVDLTPGEDSTVRLLNTTLTGVISRQGEIATDEREASSVSCATDADCDDRQNCNGHERCAPRSAGADARGCVKGAPMVCPVNQVCTENHGCRGPGAAASKPSTSNPGPATP